MQSVLGTEDSSSRLRPWRGKRPANSGHLSCSWEAPTATSQQTGAPTVIWNHLCCTTYLSSAALVILTRGRHWGPSPVSHLQPSRLTSRSPGSKQKRVWIHVQYVWSCWCFWWRWGRGKMIIIIHTLVITLKHKLWIWSNAWFWCGLAGSILGWTQTVLLECPISQEWTNMIKLAITFVHMEACFGCYWTLDISDTMNYYPPPPPSDAQTALAHRSRLNHRQVADTTVARPLFPTSDAHVLMEKATNEEHSENVSHNRHCTYYRQHYTDIHARSLTNKYCFSRRRDFNCTP